MVWRSLNFESALRFFYYFQIIKGTKAYMKILLVVFWVWSKLSQVTVTIDSLKSQDMIKTLK